MTAILLALCVLPASEPVRDRYDRIHVHHRYAPEDATYQWTQLIFEDQDAATGDFVPMAYRFCGSDESRKREMRPRRNAHGGYTARWHETWWNGQVIVREVEARSMHESWTQRDPITEYAAANCESYCCEYCCFFDPPRDLTPPKRIRPPEPAP